MVHSWAVFRTGCAGFLLVHLARRVPFKSSLAAALALADLSFAPTFDRLARAGPPQRVPRLAVAVALAPTRSFRDGRYRDLGRNQQDGRHD